MGYHLKTIAKGKLGEFSKITEEILELRDSQERLRPNPMLALCELCDLIGSFKFLLVVSQKSIMRTPLLQVGKELVFGL